jgi:hypothetical protein
MKKSNLLFFWLIIVIIISSFCALTYLVNQHFLRQGANDPQVQIAQDLAKELNSGQNLTTVANTPVDPSTSLAPFYIIYNSQEQVTVSTGMINGVLPAGVLDYVKNHGEDRITWQPNENTRIAAVVVPYKDGYVLVGRSLKEVEKRVEDLLSLVFDAWVATMLVTTALTLLISKRVK